MRNIGLDGCPKADAMLRQVDPYGLAQEGALAGPPQPLRLQAYGWAQLDDGDWEFRDPSIPELTYLQSLQQWTTKARGPIPHHYGGLTVRGRPDFVIGPDGQVTAERGLHVLQPKQAYVVSEGGLTVSSLYGAGKSQQAFNYEFHLSNPHLRNVDPHAPLPAGTRVHVPHHWVHNLRAAGYGVHRPMERAGLAGRGALGDATSIATMLTTLQNINGAQIVPDGDGSYTSFVTSQKAAGQLAIDQLNPDVDITLGAVAKPFTQQAWTLNGQLAAVNQTNSTIDDANQAKSLLGAIIQQYLNASNAVVAATPLPSAPPVSTPVPRPTAPPAPPPASPGAPTPRAAATAAALTAPSPVPVAVITPPAVASTISTPWIIGGVIGAAALLGVGVAVLKKKKAA